MELTERFECVGDDGQHYTVSEYTNFIHSRPLSGPPVRVRGMSELLTDDGKHVNDKGDGTFEIVVTGVKLRRAQV